MGEIRSLRSLIQYSVSYCYTHLLYKKLRTISSEVEKCYGNEAYLLFYFKTLVELRRLPTLMPREGVTLTVKRPTEPRAICK